MKFSFENLSKILNQTRQRVARFARSFLDNEFQLAVKTLEKLRETLR